LRDKYDFYSCSRIHDLKNRRITCLSDFSVFSIQFVIIAISCKKKDGLNLASSAMLLVILHTTEYCLNSVIGSGIETYF